MQNLSAAGPCAHDTQAQAHRGLGRAMGRGAVGRGSGLPCGQRAACRSTGDGRERGRRPCLRAPPHSPADAGLFVGRRSATAAVHAPGLRWHTGGRGRVRLRHGASQPGFAGLFSAAGSAAHAHGPLCASACKVIGPPAARMAVPPSRAPRRPCPWRYRVGVVRLRGLCAPSAAETTAAAVTVPGSAVTDPGPQTAGDGP